MARKPVKKFSPEQYEDYKLVKPLMVDMYPDTMRPDTPLPLSPAAISRMKNDPYLKYTDEALDNFFEIWQTRREYAMGVCLYQTYYCDDGSLAEPIPLEVIADRAQHLALFARSINFQQRKWIPRT